MVASLTRKPRAISGVVRPPTSRSVSAARDSGGSAGMAGEEHQPQHVVLDVVDGGVEVGHVDLLEPVSELGGTAAQGLGAPEVVDRPALRDRHQPGARVPGTPGSGHCSSAATRASCARSSASPRSWVIRARPATSRADSCRHTAVTAAWGRWTGRSHGSIVGERPGASGQVPLSRRGGPILGLGDPADLDRALPRGQCSWWSSITRRAPSSGLLLGARLDDRVATHDLLGLGVRPVGGGGDASSEPDLGALGGRDRGRRRRSSSRPRTPHPSRGPSPRRARRRVADVLGHLHKNHVAHVPAPSSKGPVISSSNADTPFRPG